MAIPPCFRLAETILPKVRPEVARRLRAKGWSQTRTAGELGVSQAMVSKYLGLAPSDDPLVIRLADDWAEDAGKPTGRDATEIAAWCRTLTSDMASDAPVDDLLAAEALLRATPPRRLVPQIGLNMARARASARTPDDILAFPGRLVLAGDALVRPAPPAWGASNHLARCLLALRSRDARVRALGSVRGGTHIVQAARRLPGKSAAIERTGREPDGEAAFVRAAKRYREANVFHDAGAVGIEPCLYIAGPDAVTVARHILRLEASLKGTP